MSNYLNLRLIFIATALTAATPLASLAEATVTVSFAGGTSGSVSDPLIARQSLDYADGTGYGYADLTSGAIRASTFAPTTTPLVYYSEALASIADSLTFNSGAQGIANLHYTLDGTITKRGRTNDERGFIYVIISNSLTGYRSIFSDELTDQQCYYATTPASCHLGTSIVDAGDISFAIGAGAYYFSIALATIAYAGNDVDFSNTALFSLSVPNGVTYTSASGHFLDAAIPPIPEPSKLQLLLVGIMGAGLFKRRLNL